MDANARQRVLDRFLKAFMARDFAALADCVTADFEWRFAIGPDAPDGKVYRGLDGLRQGFAERDAALSAVRYDDLRTTVAGERLVLEYRVSGTDRAGKSFNLRGVELFDFAGTRIAIKDVFWKQTA